MLAVAGVTAMDLTSYCCGLHGERRSAGDAAERSRDGRGACGYPRGEAGRSDGGDGCIGRCPRGGCGDVRRRAIAVGGGSDELLRGSGEDARWSRA